MRRLFKFEFRCREIHLWRVFLPGFQSQEPYLRKLLTLEQAEREKKLADPIRKSRYIVKKAILSLLLSRYTGAPPTEIKLATSHYGKPHVIANANSPTVEFNLSHSGEWLFIAFSARGPVGIDIELIIDDFPVSKISRKFFSSCEASLIDDCPKDCQAQAFFKVWVRKEAYIKAIGKGLYLSLNSFDVSFNLLAPDENPDQNICRLAEDVQNKWFFHEIPSDSKYCACLVSGFNPSNFNITDLKSFEDLLALKIIP